MISILLFTQAHGNDIFMSIYYVDIAMVYVIELTFSQSKFMDLTNLFTLSRNFFISKICYFKSLIKHRQNIQVLRKISSKTSQHFLLIQLSGTT